MANTIITDNTQLRAAASVKLGHSDDAFQEFGLTRQDIDKTPNAKSS